MEIYAPQSFERFGKPGLFLAPRKITAVWKGEEVKDMEELAVKRFILYISCAGSVIPVDYWSDQKELFEELFMWCCECIAQCQHG